MPETDKGKGGRAENANESSDAENSSPSLNVSLLCCLHVVPKDYSDSLERTHTYISMKTGRIYHLTTKFREAFSSRPDEEAAGCSGRIDTHKQRSI